MHGTTLLDDVDALAASVPDGAKIALFKDGGVAMALGFALIRRGVRNLHVVTVPTGGLLVDALIGAGCVATIETAGVSLGEFGLAPRFVAAVKNGAVRILDSSCPAIYSALQAAEKGIPFMPLRGLLGSDVLAQRADYRIIDNPFAEHDPIVALPAITPDFALFHAPCADRLGNVYVGRQHELKLLAHAARASLVTVERIVEGNLLEQDELAAATLNGLYVTAIAPAPRGAAPSFLSGHYAFDQSAMAAYAKSAGSAEGFSSWLATHAGVARAAA